jgi:DNA-binding GntR family transcriptional regulator
VIVKDKTVLAERPFRPAKLSRLDWEPLHERVYSELRNALISARLAPGQKLTVRYVATSLGVSPTPVRFALSRLIAERAVTLLSNGTVAVPTMTRARFDDLISLRMELEGMAAERAAARVTDAELRQLERSAIALSRAADRDDADAYLAENQRFKFAVVDAAHSPPLRGLVESLWLQFGPFMRHYSKGIRAQLRIDQHDKVVDALRKRNGKFARLSIQKDIADGAKFLVKVAEFADERATI